jgi:hypothetical protein
VISRWVSEPEGIEGRRRCRRVCKNRDSPVGRYSRTGPGVARRAEPGHPATARRHRMRPCSQHLQPQPPVFPCCRVMILSPSAACPPSGKSPGIGTHLQTVSLSVAFVAVGRYADMRSARRLYLFARETDDFGIGDRRVAGSGASACARAHSYINKEVPCNAAAPAR